MPQNQIKPNQTKKTVVYDDLCDLRRPTLNTAFPSPEKIAWLKTENWKKNHLYIKRFILPKEISWLFFILMPQSATVNE